MNPDQGDYFAAPAAPPAWPQPSAWAPAQPAWAPAQPGWAPPAGWAPPPYLPPPVEQSESGVGVGESLLVTGLVLAASLFLTLGVRGHQTDQFDTALRKGLVYTLFFYLAVGSLIAIYVVTRKVTLVWHRSTPLAAVAVGVPVGALGGALAVALNSAIKGHLSGDPSMELLVGGGGALRIFVALVVTSVMAPLVEETVFRGICAGSLLAKGSAAALWLSALAFAIWHMQPASLRYYALMGLLLGRLWQKRGLLASMTAHACFNGMLTVAAIAATGGAATYTSYGQLRFELPGGWHASQTESVQGTTVYTGPAGAELAFRHDTANLTIDQMLASVRLSAGSSGMFSFVPGSERAVDVHGVDAVSADIVMQSQPGHALLVPLQGVVYTVMVVTGGSPNGERDWQRLERTLELVPQG